MGKQLCVLTGLLWMTGIWACPAPETRDDGIKQPVEKARLVGRQGPSAREAVARLPQLTRDDFNRIAASMDSPLFWAEDSTMPGVLEPGELAILGVDPKREAFVKDGQFTEGFFVIYRSMLEQRRREAVKLELDQGRPTLIRTDFSKASQQDQAIVKHITQASRIIEELFALQMGSFGLRSCLLPLDQGSRALFRRNQGPWCRKQPGTDPGICAKFQ